MKPRKERRRRPRYVVSRRRLDGGAGGERLTYDAIALAEDAAEVARAAAVVAEDVATATPAEADRAATVVEEAAAVVQEAAVVVQESAAALRDGARPQVERRRRPRLAPLVRHEAHVQWGHLALYLVLLIGVTAVGAYVIWSFFERQSLTVVPEPLPKVTLATTDPSSPETAAWVRLLTAAEMSPSVIPIDKLDTVAGVVVLVGVKAIPPDKSRLLDEFARRGGSFVIGGMPPATRIAGVPLTAEVGESDTVMHLAEAGSPILARLQPGQDVQMRRSRAVFLTESSRMVIAARWRENARAAVAHLEERGTRFLWVGFAPDALADPKDRYVLLMLRTGFRWVAGQPVSDGAVGAPQTAKTLDSAARHDARASRFAFSAERLRNRHSIAVTMMNRGTQPIANPTVKVWLPPRAKRVALGGDLSMRRNATLLGLPDERACLVTVPTLAPNQTRVLKLRVGQDRDGGR